MKTELLIRVIVDTHRHEAYETVDRALDIGTVQDAIRAASADAPVTVLEASVDFPPPEPHPSRDELRLFLDKIETIVRALVHLMPSVGGRTGLRILLTEIARMRRSIGALD
jgi:hypothetical protein